MSLKLLNSITDINAVVGNTTGKLIVIRFGDAEDPLCMHTDQILERISEKMKNFVNFFVCERKKVKELINIMDLTTPMNIMCFYNAKHIKIDCSSGDNEKINFFIENENDFIKIFTEAYKAGVKNKGLATVRVNLENI